MVNEAKEVERMKKEGTYKQFIRKN